MNPATGGMPCAGNVCMAAPAPPATPAAAPVAHYGEIDTAALAAMVMAKTPMVILDARSGKYDDGRRLPGAKQLAPDATPAEVAKAIPAKDTLVVVYCSNLKCPASKHLAEQLLKLGHSNVLKYPQGIEEWVATGHPVENPK
jgi:rhodanese-related sulfurtransferase